MSYKQKLVGMLMGGHNSEHEVSMRTGAALAAALRRRGYRVEEIVVDENVAGKLVESGVEVAFVALHGRWGEDGCVQGLLECMRIPYTGSGVLASALSMDKVFSKKLFRQAGLPVAPDVVVSGDAGRDLEPSKLPFDLPVVVKPSREGSSVGVSIVRKAADLAAALEQAAGLAGDVLVEQYVPGREISVAVLDGRALGAIEIKPAREFYDYTAKYHSQGTTDYLFPAPLEEGERERAHELAQEAYRCLGCSGVARVDLILGTDGRFVVLEVNTIPGMTEASLVPKIAAGVGIGFDELAERILEGAALKA
ncbi:MAG: D-alanine--D-alanine ligase [Deltaproteobacteria bacterium]|nr:MAG: D-alanine--D-alanine ligase [Deltaproteobacteria bacterium]